MMEKDIKSQQNSISHHIELDALSRNSLLASRLKETNPEKHRTQVTSCR